MEKRSRRGRIVLLTALMGMAACSESDPGGFADSASVTGLAGNLSPAPQLSLSLHDRQVLYPGDVVASVVADRVANVSPDGNCRVSYHSGDPGVARVDQRSGVVTAVAPGEAEIFTRNSRRCRDASVDIEVRRDQLSFAAWIGVHDSRVRFDPFSVDYDWFRSRDADCDVVAYASCDTGLFEPLGPGWLTDSAVNLTHTAYYVLQSDSTTSTPLAVGDNALTALEGHAGAWFNGRHWIIGGAVGSQGDVSASIRSSRNGLEWAVETEAAPFPPRRGHQLVVHADRLWMVGGTVDDGESPPIAVNEVWSTADGLNWRLEVTGPLFTPRSGREFVSLTHAGAIWVMGASDLWTSLDGVTWREVDADFPEPLSRFDAVSWQGRIWMVTGDSVWSSTDGLNWVNDVPVAPFAARSAFQLSVYDGRLWLLPGRGAGDVWSSVDGSEWVRVADSTGFDSLYGYQGFARDGAMVLVGGGRSRRDVAPLMSADGVHWERYSGGAAFGIQLGSIALSFRGQMWLLGDWVAEPEAGVWRSTDGIDWTLATRSETGPRENTAAAVYGDYLWMVGGRLVDLEQPYLNQQLNDIWRSPDGINWERVTVQGDLFSPRSGHVLAVWQGRLWLWGGSGNDGELADAWSSADGVHWRRESVDIGVAEHGYRVVVGDNQLFLVGGRVDGEPSSTVYGSTDGINWSPRSTGKLPARVNQNAAWIDGRIWVTGGCAQGVFPNCTGLSDVWSSTDGVDWTRQADFPGAGLQLAASVVHEGAWYLLGGASYDASSGLRLYDTVWKKGASDEHWRRAHRGTVSMR